MSRKWSLRPWLAVIAAAPAVASAQHAVVSADEVRALMGGKAPVVVIDARSPAEFELGHIPGAMNLPPERVAAEAARLPKDRKTPLVFYCRGVG